MQGTSTILTWMNNITKPQKLISCRIFYNHCILRRKYFYIKKMTHLQNLYSKSIIAAAEQILIFFITHNSYSFIWIATHIHRELWVIKSWMRFPEKNIWSQSEFNRTTNMASDGIKLKRLTQLEAEERETRENRKEKKQQLHFRSVQTKAKTWIWKKEIYEYN